MEDRPGRAALLMVGSLFILGFQDSLVKLASAEMSLWQFQFLRSSINLLLILCLARIIWGKIRPRPHRLWAIALRSFFLVATMIFFFGGIPFLSLAEIAAGLYVFPFFLILFSRVILGERVGSQRIIAILAGFAGTLLILKPGTEAFSLVSLMPIFAALCYAGSILTTRKLCRTESPVTLVFGVAISNLIVGSIGILIFSGDSFGEMAKTWPYLFTGWKQVDRWVLGIIALCSLLNITATMGLAKAYQSAEATWLAPFDYSYLIFATFWGIVMWDNIPDHFTFFGMSIIAAAGIFIAWQERKQAKKSR